MGILNLTPDSFYDGGKYLNSSDIINHKIKLPALTEKDIKAIQIGKKLNIKHYALSFTNSPKDVITNRKR